MENPIKVDDLGVPLFLETPIWQFVYKYGGSSKHQSTKSSKADPPGLQTSRTSLLTTSKQKENCCIQRIRKVPSANSNNLSAERSGWVFQINSFGLPVCWLIPSRLSIPWLFWTLINQHLMLMIFFEKKTYSISRYWKSQHVQTVEVVFQCRRPVTYRDAFDLPPGKRREFHDSASHTPKKDQQIRIFLKNCQPENGNLKSFNHHCSDIFRPYCEFNVSYLVSIKEMCQKPTDSKLPTIKAPS